MSKWEKLPERVLPEGWVTEVETSTQDSSLAADADAEAREARTVLERGGWGV
ncbi:hypothetical protein [Actinokineospora sp.]|uniref:hypothetical protein n=1 Tax=Actinokineospora sp. TaxID=1872133 RepID=UPI003D6C353F